METLQKLIRQGTVNNKFIPLLCGSAFKNKGVQPLLDAVVAYLPSPMEVPHVKVLAPCAQCASHHWLGLAPQNSHSWAALVQSWIVQLLTAICNCYLRECTARQQVQHHAWLQGISCKTRLHCAGHRRG